MKYQKIIMAQLSGGEAKAFHQFCVPVHESDGRWLPCGPMREEHASAASMFGSVSDYEHGCGNSCGPLSDIQPLPGLAVVARLWLPDNYVPESAEVREEGEKRAKDYLRRMLNDE